MQKAEVAHKQQCRFRLPDNKKTGLCRFFYFGCPLSVCGKHAEIRLILQHFLHHVHINALEPG